MTDTRWNRANACHSENLSGLHRGQTDLFSCAFVYIVSLFLVLYKFGVPRQSELLLWLCFLLILIRHHVPRRPLCCLLVIVHGFVQLFVCFLCCFPVDIYSVSRTSALMVSLGWFDSESIDTHTDIICSLIIAIGHWFCCMIFCVRQALRLYSTSSTAPCDDRYTSDHVADQRILSKMLEKH